MSNDKNNDARRSDDNDPITLEFGDGTSVECDIMGVFECDGKEYIALVPDDDSGDTYIYAYKEVSEDEFDMIDIDDDDEFERVSGEFYRIVETE
jgi:uncharacterized protein YrzB (UPF0473 family)